MARPLTISATAVAEQMLADAASVASYDVVAIRRQRLTHGLRQAPGNPKEHSTFITLLNRFDGKFTDAGHRTLASDLTRFTTTTGALSFSASLVENFDSPQYPRAQGVRLSPAQLDRLPPIEAPHEHLAEILRSASPFALPDTTRLRSGDLHIAAGGATFSVSLRTHELDESIRFSNTQLGHEAWMQKINRLQYTDLYHAQHIADIDTIARAAIMVQRYATLMMIDHLPLHRIDSHPEVQKTRRRSRRARSVPKPSFNTKLLPIRVQRALARHPNDFIPGDIAVFNTATKKGWDALHYASKAASRTVDTQWYTVIRGLPHIPNLQLRFDHDFTAIPRGDILGVRSDDGTKYYAHFLDPRPNVLSKARRTWVAAGFMNDLQNVMHRSPQALPRFVPTAQIARVCGKLCLLVEAAAGDSEILGNPLDPLAHGFAWFLGDADLAQRNCREDDFGQTHLFDFDLACTPGLIAGRGASSLTYRLPAHTEKYRLLLTAFSRYKPAEINRRWGRHLAADEMRYLLLRRQLMLIDAKRA